MHADTRNWNTAKTVLLFPVHAGSFLATRILCPFEVSPGWLVSCFQRSAWPLVRLVAHGVWGYFSLMTFASFGQLLYEASKGWAGHWGILFTLTWMSAAVTNPLGRARLAAIQHDAMHKLYDDAKRDIGHAIQNHRPIDAATAKELAGIEAETYVQQQIDTYVHGHPAAQALHGQLFVFHAGMPNEYSAEADHLLITEKNIYLIETKYKSGTIHANADAAEWRTASPADGEGRQRHGTMRNALLQAKNTAKVLARECKLPVKPIPLVAIYGNEVTIAGGPSNVVAAEEVIDAIAMFERHAQGQAVLNVEHMVALLAAHGSDDPDVRVRHNARAQDKGAQRALERFVQQASID